LKIAFWSNSEEQCGVTANLAAISVASVTRYPYSIILLENKLCHNNLGRALFGNPYGCLSNDVGTNYYEGGGIEGLIRKMYRGDYRCGTLETYLKIILQEHLFYIPQSRIIHSDLFDYEFDRSIQQLFCMTEEYADICLIDTASHQNLSTKIILQESDLIVVNLSQKQSILEEFFLNYSSLVNKSVFLISNYQTRTLLDCKRIIKMYHIPSEHLIAIPSSELFYDAYRNGTVKEFIRNNYYCGKDNPNFRFIQAIKKATFTIIKKAEFMVKQKELNRCGR